MTETGAPPEPRALRIARWALPVIFLFWLYRDGLFTWFVADDFAWLSLLHLVRLRHDLAHELFAPMAQGTIRPWSERGYFMLLDALFGLDSLPFRLIAFATAAADVLLISWVTLRATRSRLAAFCAPILWTANAALARAMTWSSAYNELMCPLFLLSALALFIRYLETGNRKFWWWQLVVFSLGFGALEINVVYPVIAAAWILFVRRGSLRSVIPMACFSSAYFALHRFLAPLPLSGPYVLHFNAAIFKTLALYWRWSFVPEPFARFGHRASVAWPLALSISIAIAVFVVSEIRRGRRAPLFFMAWYLATLTPMLPLSEHRTDYYLTIPVIGMAMLGAAAVARFSDGNWLRRALVTVPLATYFWAMLPVTERVTHWWRMQSDGVRTLVLGVEAARVRHPGKAIALDGITTDLYNLSFAHLAFGIQGPEAVYLTPGSELTIKPYPGTAGIASLVQDPAVMWHSLTHSDAVVYSLVGDHLRNITEDYTRRTADRAPDRLPSRIDVGNPLYSWLLGPQWLPSDSRVRWMAGQATLRIGLPASGTQIELEGYCPRAQLLTAPRHLMVLVDGVVAGDTRIYDPESDFHRLFPMPAVVAQEAAAKKSVEIEIRVDPVDRKDGQDYGLVFGKIEIRP